METPRLMDFMIEEQIGSSGIPMFYNIFDNGEIVAAISAGAPLIFFTSLAQRGRVEEFEISSTSSSLAGESANRTSA